MTVYGWPASVPPPTQVPVVIRASASENRTAARQAARTILTEIFQSWQEPAPWIETATGPSHPIYTLSLSYTSRSTWIAIQRQGKVGIDAMELQNFPELKTVTQNFFSPSDCQKILQSNQPLENFTQAWTALESLTKAHRLPLREFPQNLPALAHHETWQTHDDIVVSLTWSHD